MLTALSVACGNCLDMVGGVFERSGVGSVGVEGLSVVMTSATMIVLPVSSSILSNLRLLPQFRCYGHNVDR